MRKLKFYGCGGQGVVTAGKVLSGAVSIHEEKYAITIPAYGHERRGAPVFTDVIVDDRPILVNCFVYEPDIVVVMDEAVVEKGIDVGAGKQKDTILVLNTGSDKMAEYYKEKFGFEKVYYSDATRIAFESIGVGIPNGSALGTLAKTGVVSIESVEAALKEFFGEKAGAKNADSARRSYEETKEI